MSIKKIVKNFSSNIFIIAEIGVNHEGDLKQCKILVDEAKKAGADAIKLQTINPDLNYCKKSDSYKLFKKCQLSKNETRSIFRYCRKENIRIFSTVGDLETLNWISKEDPFAYKISSGLFNNIPFIKEILKLKKPIFFSTGMASNKDLNNLKNLLNEYKNIDYAILDCISLYPVPLKLINLGNIKNLKKKFKCPIGFSDHSTDENIPLLATIAGAEIIEKHFSLNNKKEGFDHKISFNKTQFTTMVKAIRKYEKLLGTDMRYNIKKKQRSIFARCIVANKNIYKNEVLTNNSIIIKRPINALLRGEEPVYFDSFIGKKANKEIPKDYPIKFQDVS